MDSQEAVELTGFVVKKERERAIAFLSDQIEAKRNEVEKLKTSLPLLDHYLRLVLKAEKEDMAEKSRKISVKIGMLHREISLLEALIIMGFK